MEIYEIFNKDEAKKLTHSPLAVSSLLSSSPSENRVSSRYATSGRVSSIGARRCGASKKRNDKYFTRKLVSPFAQAENTKTRLERNGRSRNLFISALFRGGGGAAYRMSAVCKFFGTSVRACNNFMEIASPTPRTRPYRISRALRESPDGGGKKSLPLLRRDGRAFGDQVRRNVGSGRGGEGRSMTSACIHSITRTNSLLHPSSLTLALRGADNSR